MLLDYPSFLHFLSQTARISSAVWVGGQETAAYGWILISAASQGYILTAGCLIGFVYYAIKRRPEHVVVLAFVLVFCIVVGGQQVQQPHWLIPILICGMVFAGALFRDAVHGCLRSARQTDGRAAFGWLIVLLAVVAETLPRCVVQDWYLTLPDTRTLAKEWIEENIQPGSSILMDRGRFIAGYTAPIHPNAATIERLYLKNDAPQSGAKGFREVHASAYFQLLMEATRNQKTYNIIPVLHDIHGGQVATMQRPLPVTLDEGIRQGVRYVITSSAFSERYFAPDQTASNLEYSRPFVELYQSIERRCVLLREFAPAVYKVQGPVIRVYQVGPGR